MKPFSKNFKIVQNRRKCLYLGFFCYFIEIPWFGRNDVYGCFWGCQIRVCCENWSRIIFGWSWHHFCPKIGLILRMVCCTGSVMSPSCFWSNFIEGWGTFTKILCLSKMSEIAFTISGWFLPNLSKFPDLDERTSRQVFKIALIKPVAVIELGPFLGALGRHYKYGWPYGRGNLTSLFPIEFYSKIRHFCKHLKIVQNG